MSFWSRILIHIRDVIQRSSLFFSLTWHLLKIELFEKLFMDVMDQTENWTGPLFQYTAANNYMYVNFLKYSYTSALKLLSSKL